MIRKPSRGHFYQIEYPEIEDNTKQRHRFMSSYDQRKESFDKSYQYLLFGAEPYEIIAFKVLRFQVQKLDKSTPKCFSHWDPDVKMFTLLKLIRSTRMIEADAALVTSFYGGAAVRRSRALTMRTLTSTSDSDN